MARKVDIGRSNQVAEYHLDASEFYDVKNLSGLLCGHDDRTLILKPAHVTQSDPWWLYEICKNIPPNVRYIVFILKPTKN